MTQISEQQLSTLLEHNGEVREKVWHIVKPHVAPRQETEDRFERMFAELHRTREELRLMREESDRRWRENQEESDRRWQENQKESDRRWQENQDAINLLRKESDRRWQENKEDTERRWQENKEDTERRWQENKEDTERRWQENQANIDALVKRIDKKDAQLGAIGARWGVQTEASFRNAMSGILEDVSDIDVFHYEEHDDQCEVFEQPAQVEIDVIIRNGVLMLCEIKSSVSRSDVNTFQRKVEFYEKRTQRKATHKIIISPFLDQGAMRAAEYHSIIVYSYPYDVIDNTQT